MSLLLLSCKELRKLTEINTQVFAFNYYSVYVIVNHDEE